MPAMTPASPDEQLRVENAELRARLEEAEETLRAIRSGEVEALVVETADGPQIFTLQGLDAESNRFRGEILAQVSDAVIAVDGEERVTYLNAAAERQYGVCAATALGRQLSEIYTRRWPHAATEAGMWAALREHGEWRSEIIHRTPDGREIAAEMCVTALRDASGGPAGYVGVFRDITERKQAEAVLKSLKEASDLKAAINEQLVVSSVRQHEAAEKSNAQLQTEITERKRSEAELQRVSVLLDTLLRTAPIGFCFLDRDLRCLRINERLAEMNGLPAGALVGRHVSEFVPTLVETLRDVTGRILATGEAVLNHEFSGETPAAPGVTRCWNESWYPVRDGAGEILGFGAIVEEITVRKAAEAAQRRSEDFARQQWAEAEAALEAVPANIAILDATAEIVRVNRAWTAFAAANGAALGAMGVGTNYLAVCAAATGPETAHARRFAAGIRRVISGECDRFSMEYPCHSPAEQRWFMGYATVAIGAGPARAVVAHVEITAQKRVEEEVRRLNDDLESRVMERTTELRIAVDALEAEIAEGQRLKTEVLRIADEERLRVAADLHDGICQELVGIQFFAETLRRALQESGHPRAAAALRIAEALSATVEHTRQVARGMNPVVADGNGLMHALRQLTGTTTRTRRIRCVFQCPKPVVIENRTAANELYRIAQEAIHNADRHGKAQRITVRLGEAAGETRLAVLDDGCGLPAALTRGPGMGLRVMQYRAGSIGGRLVIQPRKTRGTEVICCVAHPPKKA